MRKSPTIQTCLNCGLTFSIYNSYLVTKRPTLYCSVGCGKTKHSVNQRYFSPPLTPDKLITLGQFVATSYIQNDHTIIVRSDEVTLNDIQRKLNSTYPIEKSDNGKLKISIRSSQIVRDLGDYGIVHNPLFQEYPPYDILTGLLSTDCYEKKDGAQMFRTPSSKLSLEVARLVGGEVITETYKDIFRGVLGCDYVVVWSD